MLQKGSSPLTRGKRFPSRRWPRIGGLIPAHAGKTISRGRSPSPSWAHPRSRGENRFPPRDRIHANGSSPLTRGKPPQRRNPRPSAGLIPAHAGKTRQMRDMRQKCRAHPRSRGENIKAAVSVVVEWGSSPLTRGKPRASHPINWFAGLIPAHAGKTPPHQRHSPGNQAHPRSRGENCAKPGSNTIMQGSSPLTRGKPWERVGKAWERGLIPAHAGKTRSDHGRRNRPRAHPRSRGENY